MFPVATYRIAGAVLRRLPQWSSPAGASLAGRAAATPRWLAWARSRPRSGPIIWVHAASVGEALVAQPVIERLRAARPEITVVLSYTSPSLARWPGALPVDHSDFAPAEDAGAMTSVFDALAPALLVCARSDLWPEMLLAARRRRVPVAVIGGLIRERSHRLRAPWLFRTLYQDVSWVGAVSDADAGRWIRLGVPELAVQVTGDPRHDQVLERVPRLPADRSLADWCSHHPVLVAGSVEPADEGPLLGAFAMVRRARPDARVLIVPHDPAAASGTRRREDPGIVVETGVGALFDRYALATVAYVGGGFGRAGLHSTVEPAAFAVPTLTGPAPAGQLAARWLEWLNDPAARAAAGLAARRGVQAGAARVTTLRLLELLA